MAESHLPTLEERIRFLLLAVAEGEPRPCKLCKALIVFVRHKNGKLAPYTLEGLNHFIDCPQREAFQKKK